MSEWKFADNFDFADREYLTDHAIQFTDIVSDILAGDFGDLEQVKPVSGALKALEAIRYSIPIKVTSKAYDLFYNGINGYRAHYLQSPWAGIACNAEAIYALGKKILEINDTPDLEFYVLAQSSKIWIKETNILLESAKNSPLLELDITQWTEQAQIEHQSRDPQSGLPKNSKPIQGVQAYLPSKDSDVVLEFKTPFLTSTGMEITPKNKILRAQDINMYGFS